jgi:hypothetical protein
MEPATMFDTSPLTVIRFYPTDDASALATGSRSFAPWFDLRDAMASWYGYDADDLRTREAYFGGEYGDDDSREIVTYRGRIIGAIDQPITSAQVAEIEAAERVADVGRAA